MRKEENNMFRFATKELSQDAFLCWLINGINTEDREARELARNFIKLIVNKIGSNKLKKYIESENYRVEIKPQYKNIDVLLILGEYYVIIEDKIKMVEHDDQINKYESTLIENGVNHNCIFTCYYKIYDEYNIYNKHVDSIITRRDMIELLKKSNVDNMYVAHYFEYLEEIERYSTRRDIVSEKIRNEKSKVVRNIQDAIYTGFFSELEKKEKPENIVGWNYADNRAGGTWWYASKIFNNVESKDFSYIYADINLKDDRNRIVLKLAKKEEIMNLTCEDKLKNYLNEEYIVDGKVKYYDRKDYYVRDYENNKTKKMAEYKYYKNIEYKVDIFDKVVTDDLLNRLKKYDIGLKDGKGIIRKNENAIHKYYMRIASIDVNKYTLTEIEEILNELNCYLGKLKICC